MNTSDKLIVDGFKFSSMADAELAQEEIKKIEYIDAKLDYDSPDTVLSTYQKIISNRVLCTPVGHAYLKRLQNFLLDSPYIDDDEIPEILLYTIYGTRADSNYSQAVNRIQPRRVSSGVVKLRVSVVINIMMAALVVTMFVLTLKSDNPNILNYKSALENKYAAWEQELTDRENAVREKERELFKEK